MKCAALFALGLALAGCGTNASIGNEPEGLALTDVDQNSDQNADQNIASDEIADDVLVIEIAGEQFELTAGICNTYDDGTFRFALAEGPVGSVGRGTATVERFDTGVGHEVIIAFEGVRDDKSQIAWYARESLPVHAMTVSVFGSSLDGAAVFDSAGGSDTPGEKRDGTFAIRCSPTLP